jgi:hypothetical protein
MPRPRRLVPTLLRAVLLAAALGAVLASPAAAAPTAETGLNLNAVGQALDPAVLARLQGAGTRWVRTFMTWPSLEPARGQYNAAALDALRQAGQALHARGMKLEVVVVKTPAWANGGAGELVPPTDPADFGTGMGQIATQTRGRVDAWELWNEEDSTTWFKPGPDAGAYAGLLRAAYPRIKQADPAATVIMGGLTGNDASFLEQVYAAGGGGQFDAVSTHTDTACLLNAPSVYYREPSGRVAQWSFLGYREVHDVMQAHGDGAKPMILTEIGWSTTTAICGQGQSAGKKAGGVSEADQARFLQQAYHCLAETPYVQAAFWFNHQDGPDDTEYERFGLLRPDGSPKPAWDAFRTVGLQGDLLSGDCGDFRAPALTVQNPVPGTQVASALPIVAQASDATGVSYIHLFVDGRRIKGGWDRSHPQTSTLSLSWTGAKALAPGAHTLRAEAGDPLGNVAREEVAFTKVATAAPPTSKPTPARTRVSLRVTGRGRTRTARARVLAGVRVDGGGLRLVFERRTRRGWAAAHSTSRAATRPAALTRRLRPGTWRVSALYRGRGTLLSSTARSKRFRVR